MFSYLSCLNSVCLFQFEHKWQEPWCMCVHISVAPKVCCVPGNSRHLITIWRTVKWLMSNKTDAHSDCVCVCVCVRTSSRISQRLGFDTGDWFKMCFSGEYCKGENEAGGSSGKNTAPTWSQHESSSGLIAERKLWAWNEMKVDHLETRGLAMCTSVSLTLMVREVMSLAWWFSSF